MNTINKAIKKRINMIKTFEKYGSAVVPVINKGLVTSGKHKGYDKLITKRAAGKRPAESVDYRKPNKVYRHSI